MQYDDLGPLSKAILEAALAAEQLGVAPTVPLLWRTLPGYDTHLANVEAALRPGSPALGWLVRSGDLVCASDRERLPAGMGSSRQRGTALRERLRPALAGLAKLPMIEAVAVVGPLAWGHRADEQTPADLIVLAEGGRTELVRRAIAAWRRARGEAAEAMRLVALVDADHLDDIAPDPGTALALATLRPVSHAAAWQELLAASPWIAERHPNASLDAPELPDWSATGGRLEGRLAALRRKVVPGSDEEPLLRSRGRRPGPLGRLEGLLRTRRGERATLAPMLDGFAEDLEARRDELATWTPEDPAPRERSTPAKSAAAASSPRVEPTAPDAGSVGSPEAAPDSPSDEPGEERRVSSRRRRGARRVRSRRSAASSETGQRARGRGRRRRDG